MYQKVLSDQTARALKSVDRPPKRADEELHSFKVAFHYQSGSGRTGVAWRVQEAASESVIADEFDELWEADGLLRFKTITDSVPDSVPADSLMVIPARNVYRMFVTRIKEET